MRPRTAYFVPGRVGSGVGWRPRFVVVLVVLLVLVVPSVSWGLLNFWGSPGPPRWGSLATQDDGRLQPPK